MIGELSLKLIIQREHQWKRFFACFRFFFVVFISHLVLCESENSDVCTTSACELESENILAKLDEAADPCEDFYLFACGNFINETVIPDDKSTVDVATILNDQLKGQLNEVLNSSISDDDEQPFVLCKKLFKACLNEGKFKVVGEC